MSIADRLASVIISHTRVAIAVALLLVLVVGAGAPMVESVSSLEQFQGESEEADKLEFVEENFGDEVDTTAAQIIIRDENVLSRDSLIATLSYQQEIRDNEKVQPSLVEDDAFLSVAGLIADTIYRQQLAAELDLESRAQQIESDRRALENQQATIEQRQADLNETRDLLAAALAEIEADPTLDADEQFSDVAESAPITLKESHAETFAQAAELLRQAETESEIEAAYRLGTEGVLDDEYEELSEESDSLEQRGDELEQRGEQLEADRERVQEPPNLSVEEQIDVLDAANETELEAAIEAVLSGENGGTDSPLALMPTDYEPGSTTADATILFVTQERLLDTAVDEAASEQTITAQLEMRAIGNQIETLDIQVFGSGIIAHEIDASLADSLLIVAPLALLFVLVALSIAYRDPLDILLGVFGIGVVLLMTLGFMGWTDIDFGQVFIAVPVLLIGLSIDYAIHIFMRHREHRDEETDGVLSYSNIRDAMRVALAGVGTALVFVTATTAIGFLSNLTSPVQPIREFGLVSAVGIVSALLVFGVLVPSLKTEVDDWLEGRGVDRRKRAFGTGGGRFSKALTVGAIAARRKPMVVLGLVLVLTGAGIYGGVQVDTTFEQRDFLADDPPEWTKNLPGPFALETYTAKSSLDFVNERFVRSDANTQILVEGDITDDDTLARISTAQADAAERPVTQRVGTGEAVVDTPLTVMRSVAAENATFNETFTEADTTNNGVPDQNIEDVYDELFRVAPDQAGQYIYRTDDGDYRALRMVVAVRGDVPSADVTDQMQAVAAGLDGDGFEVTATGGIVLNTIVQDQILETVLQSLLITLVVIFLFLMGAYRITDGSALLGAVTLLPVAFASAWIGGSMYLLDIPFNVITGMILSLTIGLGVAYSIHISERFTLELGRGGAVWPAMRKAVTGTGGALLGSGATTVGGFGVLLFAILPPLRQFGLITALSIIYAFIGSVLVLPTLLAGWTRLAGPSWARSQVIDGRDGTAENRLTEESDSTPED